MSNQRRKGTNTTVDQTLWFYVKLIALNMSNPRTKTKVNANDLLEEGLKYIISKYHTYLPDEYKIDTLKIEKAE